MQKIINLILCLILLAVPFSVLTCAEEINPTVTVSTEEANVGDYAYVSVSIKDNPGISAITATVNYNSEALEYLEYTKGPAMTDSFMLKAHPDKNYIKFVVVEYSRDSFNNDDIITLKFKVKDNALAKLYEISVENNQGDFASRTVEKVTPIMVSGGVKVNYSPEINNCPHESFGEWKTVLKPTCESEGVKERACLMCGKKEFESIDITDHEYESFWTVDTPASETRDGVMTRHCKHCTATTDTLVFEYKDTTSQVVENTVGDIVSNSSFAEILYEEQIGELPEDLTDTSSAATSTEATANTSENATSSSAQQTASADSQAQSTAAIQSESSSQTNASTDSPSADLNSTSASEAETQTAPLENDSSEENTNNSSVKRIIIVASTLLLVIIAVVVILVIKKK